MSELKVENPDKGSKADNSIAGLPRNGRPKVGDSTFVMNSKSSVANAALNTNGENEDKLDVDEEEFIN